MFRDLADADVGEVVPAVLKVPPFRLGLEGPRDGVFVPFLVAWEDADGLGVLVDYGDAVGGCSVFEVFDRLACCEEGEGEDGEEEEGEES